MDDIDKPEHAEALRRAHDRLTAASTATTLRALTAFIGHEVNQPVSGIVTNAGTCLRMLDRTPPDVDGAREVTHRISRDANRAGEVIARLRASFDRRDAAHERLDLN